jgi:DNA helicase HerA-like ATPase
MRSRAAHIAARATGESPEHLGAIDAARSNNDLPDALPADALDDRIAIVGTAGSGKTYTAKGFVEQLLEMGARAAIVDPLGVWWGLRASADGSAPGYPVVVFGGRHADVPIADHRRNGDGPRSADRQRSARLRRRSLRTRQQRRAPAFHGGFFRGAVRGERGAAASASRALCSRTLRF